MAIFRSNVGPYPAKSYGSSMSTFMNNINANAKIVCDEIVTNGGDTFVTKTYVDSILGLNNDMYFPHEYQKQLRELLLNASNEDAKKILHILFIELTKANKNIDLSKDVEAAIIAMNVDTI